MIEPATAYSDLCHQFTYGGRRGGPTLMSRIRAIEDQRALQEGPGPFQSVMSDATVRPKRGLLA